MTPATFHPERSWLNEEAARNTHSMSFTAPVSQERGAPPLLNPLLWMMVRKRWMSSLAQSEATQGRYGPGSHRPISRCSGHCPDASPIGPTYQCYYDGELVDSYEGTAPNAMREFVNRART